MSDTTRVRFFTGSEQPEKDFCRLIASAYRHGHQVQVLCSDHAQAEAMNQALWKFPDGDFVPHCSPNHPLAAHTPVWITTELSGAHSQVLVNLAAAVPTGFERFAQVVELVPEAEGEQRQLARQRFAHYRAQGYTPETHTLEPTLR